MIYIITIIRKQQTVPRSPPLMSATMTSTLHNTDYEYPALCIPRALGETTQEEIHRIIHRLGLGDISKIVIKPKEFVLPKWERTATTPTTPTTPTEVEPSSPQTVAYNNIYIYFKRWNIEKPLVRRYRDNIIKGQTIKIVHKMIPTPIFWRCVAANFTTFKNHRNKINNTTDM